jgi:RNA polymerase sigma factor (sigma-70 family)
MKLTYREISEAINSGDDSKVLSYLYAHLLPKVRSHITRNGGNKEEAEDIFQDSIIILYQQVIDKKLKEIENIQGFLFQTTKNLWINRAKRKNRSNSLSEREADVQSDTPSAIDFLMTKEKQQAWDELFGMLGEKCCTIIALHLYDQKSMEEIAQVLELSGANAAKTQHYRCKQKLMDCMDERQDLKRILEDN